MVNDFKHILNDNNILYNDEAVHAHVQGPCTKTPIENKYYEL